MHIFAVNISKVMIDIANIIIANKKKLHMAFRSAYLHLTLAHAKGQGQGHEGSKMPFVDKRRVLGVTLDI